MGSAVVVVAASTVDVLVAAFKVCVAMFGRENVDKDGLILDAAIDCAIEVVRDEYDVRCDSVLFLANESPERTDVSEGSLYSVVHSCVVGSSVVSVSA